MTTVAIDYNFSTFRTKISPNTVLNDVLQKSLKHFKLPEQDDTDMESSWIFLHRDKPIALDLPWRLLNLATGAKLELKAIHQRKDNRSEEPTLVKIKFQIVEQGAFIDEVDINKDFQALLDDLAQKHGWLVHPELTNVQIFSKVIPYSELRSHTLSSLGVKESAVIKLSTPQDVNSSKENKSVTNAESPIPQVSTANDTIETKIHRLHEISAFVPSAIPIHSLIDDEDQDYELTVAHARMYQQIISKKTGALGGPLMSKRMREERSAPKERPDISICNVRIRFPNLEHIETTFAPDDTAKTIYEVVADSLKNVKSSFSLYFSHPHSILTSSDAKLVEDLEFGHRTLLLFESENDPPYLKDSLLKQAKQLKEVDDVKLDHVDEKVPKPSGEKIVSTTEKSVKSDLADRIQSERKVPKWLKLSKK